MMKQLQWLKQKLKETSRSFLLMALSVALLLSLTACGNGNERSAATATPEETGTTDSVATGASTIDAIRLDGGDWGYPSPFTHYSRGPGSYKMRLLFDSLLEKNEEQIIPWLAKSYEIEGDGSVITFHLQEDVTWQDGTSFSAEDVAFTFDYYREHPPVSNSLIIDGKYIVETTAALDANTVKITVAEPLATVLDALGRAPIIPKHIWEKVEDPNNYEEADAVIGTGPYQLSDYDAAQGSYQFVAYPDYWGPKQRVNKIQFIPVSDSNLAFDQGEIDFVGISPDLLARYENDETYQVVTAPAFWGYRLSFQMEKRPELQEQQVRQALAYAIDRDELVEKVARGAAIPGSAGFLSPDHIWFNPDTPQYQYDPEQAKALLDGKTYSFQFICGNDPKETRIAELLKMQMAEAGIQLAVVSLDKKARDAAIKNGEYELALVGHGGWGGDPDYLRTNLLSGGKVGFSAASVGYQNETLQALGEAELHELDEGKRKELIMEMQNVIAEDVPAISVYLTTGYSVYRPSHYDGWMHPYDHHSYTHSKLSFLMSEDE